jgi:hypothetical protein
MIYKSLVVLMILLYLLPFSLLGMDSQSQNWEGNRPRLSRLKLVCHLPNFVCKTQNIHSCSCEVV